MTWCLVGLLGAFLSQDPLPQVQDPGFEIVDLKPGKQKKADAASQQQHRVSAKPTGKPLEIKMPKQKKGNTKFQKPKKR